MQAWGDSSRYATRGTNKEPTKSGILGLVASAQGRRRTDPVEDLVALRFGVRTDQLGRVLSDFQTARQLDTGKSLPLTTRYYLADSIFVAGLEGDLDLLEGIDAALRAPHWAPYLGRRAFTPTGELSLGIVPEPLEYALAELPWQAADWFRRRHKGPYYASVSVDAKGFRPDADALEMDLGTTRQRDVPVSWDIRHREYGWRDVVKYRVLLQQNDHNSRPHDPMEVLS